MYYTVDLVSLLLGCLVLSIYWWRRKLRYNLPPGPWYLPLIGHLPFMQMNDVEIIKRRKNYKIFGCYFGSAYTVVMNDFEIVKEAFNNPSLLDRPRKYFEFQPGGLGFGEDSGEVWLQQRRFVFRTLNNIGLGTSEWEKDLEAEIKDLVRVVESKKCQPFDIEKELFTSLSNVLVTMIIGERIPLEDPRRMILNDGVRSQNYVFSDLSSLAIAFPKAMKFLCSLGLTRLASTFQKMLKFNHFIMSEIENRKKSANAQSDEVFIDAYLKEIQKAAKGRRNKIFNDYNLCGSAKALIIGGTDTSKTSLIWLFQAMAVHPDIQNRVHSEIDQVLGKEGRVMWTERQKLPYTTAALTEILRWKTKGPFGVIHAAGADTKVAGFDIPRGARICANIFHIHHDPMLWEEPDRFRPERFLDQDDCLITGNIDNYLPFVIGKRSCPGDKIAQMQMFHFFTAFMQRFNILPSEDLSSLFETRFNPVNHLLRFIPRE